MKRKFTFVSERVLVKSGEYPAARPPRLGEAGRGQKRTSVRFLVQGLLWGEYLLFSIEYWGSRLCFFIIVTAEKTPMAEMEGFDGTNGLIREC